MNKQELDQSVAFIFEENADIQLIIYAALKDNGGVRKLDIDNDDLVPLRDMFIESIRTQIIQQDNYQVLLLSAADERGNCFYEYDLEIPAELAHMTDVIGNDNIANFNFNNETIGQIDALIIVLGTHEHQVSLFKKLSPVEIIKRGNSYIFKKSAQRFERFDDNLLRITPSFHALSVQGVLVILKLTMIERNFGIVEVIQREALLGIDAIRNLQLVANIQTLEELVTDISFARKLVKIARSSPVIINNIPNPQIIAFALTHPALRGKIKFNEDNTMINLDTRRSKNLFVKLLNDDYLTSQLTNIYYDSLAKDGINEEEVVEQEN